MKKAFTLIEVIVVLVILAIIALITIPIVNNIIDKSEESARKRSVENYGHAIELAQSSYRLEHGMYTYDLNELKIEYTGKEVVCDELVLNENGTVYLNKCKIDGTYVEDDNSKDGYFSYGKGIPEYSIGEEVKYKNMDFYVIKNSYKNDNSITLITKKGLTKEQIEPIVMSTEIYNNISYNGNYLQMQYYYHEQCLSAGDVTDGCNNDYSVSAVKQVIDVWANTYLDDNDLVIDKNGYKARLISEEDFYDNLQFRSSAGSGGSVGYGSQLDEVSEMFSGVYATTYTMIPYEDSSISVWGISYGGKAYEEKSNTDDYIRPVITLKKSAIEE